MPTLPHLTSTYPYDYARGFIGAISHGKKLPKTYDIPVEFQDTYDSMVRYLLKWMTTREFFNEVHSTADGDIQASLSNACMMGGCPFSAILTFDMRRLYDRESVEWLINYINDTPERRGVTDYIALVTTLHTMYPETLIDLVINKVYRGLMAIPSGGETEDWVSTHVAYPYLWVLAFMNMLTKRFSDPRMIR